MNAIKNGASRTEVTLTHPLLTGPGEAVEDGEDDDGGGDDDEEEASRLLTYNTQFPPTRQKS